MYSDHQLQYPHHSRYELNLLQRIIKIFLSENIYSYLINFISLPRPISNYRSHYAQTHNSEELLTNPHPQDIGIAMKFLSPK